MTNEVPVLNLPMSPSFPFARWFVRTAAVVLGVTGAAKVWTAFAPTKVLAVADPLTGIAFGHLMLAAGVLELFVAIICLFGKSQKQAQALIAWLATNLVVYRIGLWVIDWHKPCPCLGNLTDALHISPQAADTAMKIILAYLLIGSYTCLIWLWRQRKVSPQNSSHNLQPSTLN